MLSQIVTAIFISQLDDSIYFLCLER